MDPQLDAAEIKSIRRPAVLGAIAIAVLVALAAVLYMGARLANSVFGAADPGNDRHREPGIDARAEPAQRLRRALCRR